MFIYIFASHNIHISFHDKSPLSLKIIRSASINAALYFSQLQSHQPTCPIQQTSNLTAKHLPKLIIILHRNITRLRLERAQLRAMIDMLDMIGKVGRALNQSGIAGAVVPVHCSCRQGLLRISSGGSCFVGGCGASGYTYGLWWLAMICPGHSG